MNAAATPTPTPLGERLLEEAVSVRSEAKSIGREARSLSQRAARLEEKLRELGIRYQETEDEREG